MADPRTTPSERREAYQVLRRIEDLLETPMFALSLLWIALLVMELVWGTGAVLESAVTAIWIAFLFEFAVKFIIAPSKLRHLRKNWLTVLALALPALRVLRITRVARVLKAGRAIRGLTLARVIASFNRGLRTLRSTMALFGFGYIVALTTLVTGLGAAGIYAFERRSSGGEIETFGDALWFTAMLMTTSGSDYWPRTLEGRILCFLLALYAFATFGYVTATVAALMIGRKSAGDQPPAEAKHLAELRADIRVLSRQIAELRREQQDIIRR
jgi:voltage-gated potassium channel